MTRGNPVSFERPLLICSTRQAHP